MSVGEVEALDQRHELHTLYDSTGQLRRRTPQQRSLDMHDFLERHREPLTGPSGVEARFWLAARAEPGSTVAERNRERQEFLRRHIGVMSTLGGE